MPVKFFFPDTKITLTRRNQLKQFIESIFLSEKKRLASLSYIFCNDEFLLSINQKFLKHDYYTDIVTFDLSDNNKDEIIGEIYISIDRVRENAENIGEKQATELLRVIFHGALHLCDYRDKIPKDKQIMRYKEDHYLQLYLKS